LAAPGPALLGAAALFAAFGGELERSLELANRGIGYAALDNGILSCADPKRVQAICDGLSAEKIDGLLRKWFRKLPHPFTPKDRQAGYRYQISILQAEFALTQVLDRPVSGRIFFEEVIRENLDIGRPSQVQLIRWRGSLAARRLQKLSHQAVPQGRACTPHRNDHQQHARLRHRQAIEEPARTTAGRLSSQPTSLGRPNCIPRLFDWRRRI